MTTEEFIREHRNDDVRRLALQVSRHLCIDMPYALDQISGWQTACRKLPSWAAVDGIIYPPHISMEQCSSEHTAMYKAGIFISHSSFIDLTGGFGVDFSFMSRGFSRAVYVERQEHLCDIARHNFALLGLDNTEVVCGDGIEYLHKIDYADVIYLDPARRDTHGSRTYAISDCTPDVTAVERELLDKAGMVMLKLSPMLDITKTVTDLERGDMQGVVRRVCIVSVDNECKELLVILSAKLPVSPLEICCVDISSKSGIIRFCYTPSQGQRASYPCHAVSGDSLPAAFSGKYLYEPNASIMKAGCFDVLCERYGVRGIGRNSHLFISDEALSDFPGRSFVIKDVTTMNKKELKTALAGISRANITVRNFPMSVPELRKRLKLADGGDVYIFATTLSDSRRVLFIAN